MQGHATLGQRGGLGVSLSGKMLEIVLKRGREEGERPPPSLEPALLQGSLKLEIKQPSSWYYK